MKYLAFPWGPLGNMLRRLSLSGGAGNVTAWVLFLAAGALPVVCWGVLFLKKRAVKADWLLFLLSAAMFAGLWLLVNPSYLEQKLFPPGIGEMGMPAVALTMDSILVTWVFCRFLEKYEKLGKIYDQAGMAPPEDQWLERAADMFRQDGWTNIHIGG